MSCPNQIPPVGLLSALQDVRALVDVYIEIVDQVMRLHGFDREKCEFLFAGEVDLPARRLQSTRTILTEEVHALALAG